MEYFIRYGLEFNPFLKNAREILLDTSEFREVQLRLNYLLETKGFGVLTGGAGNPSLYKVVYSSLSTLTVTEFYRNLAAGLGLEPKFRKPDNFRMIQDEICRYTLEKRITPVIIIDEANHICTGILNDLKILFNFEMDSKDRAVLLLAGLPSLNNTLRLSIHEPLRQRITMNYHIDGLTKEESKQYILTKLTGARCTGTVFNENALEALANAANGVPRVLNKLCNSCLMIGNSRMAEVIDEEIVMQAVNDCQLG